MARKKGLLALLAGLAVGAAALFLSKEENRQLVAREAKKAARKGRTVARRVAKRARRIRRK